jgi:acetylornithine deacetylase/succinyl-diaminopimelate desuccinylase-like protein
MNASPKLKSQNGTTLRAVAGLWRAGLISLCTVACATRATSEPPSARKPAAVSHEPDCPRALAFDQRAIADEMVCLLSHYVQIDTTNPPGNEIAAARFLERVVGREGIPVDVIEAAPGRANLIARLRGRGKGKGNGRAMMLMHHMDVVPASADEWSVPPLSGTVRDGQVWGRGTLDNKGSGVVGLMTLLLLKRLAVPIERDLVFLAVADEEAGGGYGARWLTEHRQELFEDVEFVLNEGGGILHMGGGRVVYGVELAQKAPLWLRVTARGTSGHGAAPGPESAVSVLVRALARLANHRFPLVVLPEVQAMFAARAAAMPEALRGRYGDLGASLKDEAFREQFLSDARNAALVQNTVAITMLAGSAKENVISERASAVLDVRLLPGQETEPVIRELASVMGECSLELEPILSWRAYTSPRDTALFAAIETLAKQRDPGAPVTTHVIGGFTDCNAFRAKGIVCYGFMPVRLTPEDLTRVHGKDERVPIEPLSRAVLDLYALVRNLGSGSGT